MKPNAHEKTAWNFQAVFVFVALLHALPPFFFGKIFNLENFTDFRRGNLQRFFFGGAREALDRVFPRVFGQIEFAPVNGQYFFRANIVHGLRGLFGRGVNQRQIGRAHV